MNNTDAKSTKCDECGAFHGMHALACSRQTYEQMQQQVLDHHSSWQAEHQRYNTLHARLKQHVTLWQGKCAILRHENNKLRDRNRKLEADGTEKKNQS